MATNNDEHEWCCDATLRCERGRECDGWRPGGFPWHGCMKEPGHRAAAVDLIHECRCGKKWDDATFGPLAKGRRINRGL